MGRLMLLLLLVSVALPPRGGSAQATADDSIASHLRRVGLRHEAPGVVLWTEPGTLTRDEGQRFATRLSRGIGAIEETIGRRLDTAHYEEDTIQVFVGTGVRPSHVYAGYAHMRHRKPYLYLDAELVRTDAAPYLHELTHILLWRFGSHSLREGFASYVEIEVSARGEGRNSELFGMSSPQAADRRARELLNTPAGQGAVAWIGRGGQPDPQVTSPENRQSRAGYYVLSQSFVRFLVDRLGMAAVVKLYEAADVEHAASSQTGRSMEEWKRAWIEHLAGT